MHRIRRSAPQREVAKQGKEQEKMPDEQTDDTSIPLIEDQYFRDFLNGKGPFESQADFPSRFQRVAAEMNRRLARQQGKFLAAQNILLAAQNQMLESQEAVAKSLTWATWVLAVATLVLAGATIVLVVKTA